MRVRDYFRIVSGQIYGWGKKMHTGEMEIITDNYRSGGGWSDI